MRPFDLNLAQDVAKIYIQLEDIPKAIEVFESAMLKETKTKKSGDNVYDNFTFDHLNVFTELYMLSKDFKKVHEMITTIGKHILRKSGVQSEEPWASLPLDLRVKLGVSLVHLRQLTKAKPHLAVVDSFELNAVADLQIDIADAYFETRHYELALKKYLRLVRSDLEAYQNATIWGKTADAARALGQNELAVQYYQKILEQHPKLKGITLLMAECYDALGNDAHADRLRKEIRGTKATPNIIDSLISARLASTSLTGSSMATASAAAKRAMDEFHTDDSDDYERMMKDSSAKAAAVSAGIFLPDTAATTKRGKRGGVGSHASAALGTTADHHEKSHEITERLLAAKTAEHREKYDRARALWGEEGERLVRREQLEEFRLLARSLLGDFQACERFFNPRRLRPFRAKRARGPKKRKFSEKKLALNDALREATSSTASTSAGAASGTTGTTTTHASLRCDTSPAATDSSDASDGSEDMDEDDEDIDYQATGSAPALEDAEAAQQGPSNHLGLEFSEWFDINVVYAFFLVKLAKRAEKDQRDPISGDPMTPAALNKAMESWYEEAERTLATAERCSIFYYNQHRRYQIFLCRMSKYYLGYARARGILVCSLTTLVVRYRRAGQGSQGVV